MRLLLYLFIIIIINYLHLDFTLVNKRFVVKPRSVIFCSEVAAQNSRELLALYALQVSSVVYFFFFHPPTPFLHLVVAGLLRFHSFTLSPSSAWWLCHAGTFEFYNSTIIRLIRSQSPDTLLCENL